MTRISQKERELEFISQFKTLLDEFPNGEIIPGDDPPDYIVSSDNKSISIEVTELYPQVIQDEIRFDKRLELEKDILKKARFRFEAVSDLSLNVIVQFKPRFVSSKQYKEIIAEGICQAIDTKISGNQIQKKFLRIQESKFLPKEVENILITFQAPNSNPIWQSGHGSQIRKLTLQELKRCISSKENSVTAANKNLEQWLLIVEPHDKLFYHEIPEFTNDSVDSSFDRVFILRSLFSIILEVKINYYT